MLCHAGYAMVPDCKKIGWEMFTTAPDCFNIGWEMFTMAPDWFNIGLEMFMSDYYGQNSLVFLISKLSLVYAVSQW